jgi:hypothetical protein
MTCELRKSGDITRKTEGGPSEQGDCEDKAGSLREHDEANCLRSECATWRDMTDGQSFRQEKTISGCITFVETERRSKRLY